MDINERQISIDPTKLALYAVIPDDEGVRPLGDLGAYSVFRLDLPEGIETSADSRQREIIVALLRVATSVINRAE